MTAKTSRTHLVSQPSEGVLVESDGQRQVHGAGVVGAVAAPAGLNALPTGEIASDPRAVLGAYFDRYMANPHFGRMSDDPEKMTEYRDVFTDFLITAFDPDLIAQKPWPNQDYYPAASEFAGMLASMYHNAGVYYPDAEVSEIFLVVANEIVNDELLQQEIQTISGDAVELNRILRSCMVRKMSVDTETALALFRGEDGHWAVLDTVDIGERSDINPLEVIRQDNDDKGGWNKYRFRQPVYVRSKDEAHPREAADGWYTSEWYAEPNYWSAELRNMFVTAVEDIDDRLEEIGAHAVMVTNGGILKGTSTAETDTDTECIVVCSSIDDFTQADKMTAGIFEVSFAGLPFSTKESGIGFRFFDKSEGKIYFHRSEGEYSASTFGEIFKGGYIFRVGKNEKGVGITTRHGFSPYRKPKVDGDMYVSIDLESGNVTQLNDQELAEYTSAQKEARRQAQAQATHNDPAIVW